MKPNVLVVCQHEGGLFQPYDGKHAPIRIYSNGVVEDDIYFSHTGEKVREKLSQERLSEIIDAAIDNKRNGLR